MIIDEIVGTKIKVFNGKTIDLLEVFNVDPEDLSNAFAQQAALYAYFSTLQAESERLLSIAKFDVEQEYATADEYHRHFLDKREKKYTESVIRSLVIRDDKYVQKEEMRIALEYEVNLMKAIVRALAQRGDMLISLGAMTRQELSMTGMSLKERASEELPKDVKTAVMAARRKRDSQV